MTSGGSPVDRRLVLTLGAAGLLGACSGTGHASPGTSGTTPGAARPSPSGAVPAASGPLPSTSLTAAPASAQVCRTVEHRRVDGALLQEHVSCTGPGSRDIALTIDDGPDPAYTPAVLALLQRLGIRATFCVVGARAEKHPDLVRAAAQAGHVIANHTQTHTFLGRQPATRVHEEVSRATDAITKAAGQPPTLFRAPGGFWSRAVFAECAAHGLRPLGWSVDPRDWSRPGTSSIVRTLLGTTRPGSIILDHDGGGDRSQTVEALGLALPRLLDAGYRFVQP